MKNYFGKSHVSENWSKIAKKARKRPKILKKTKKAQNFKIVKKTQNFKIGKKARIFSGHSVQDCSKRALVYMGIFFIEAIKKAWALKFFL